MMELTLLEIQVEVVFPEFFQDLRDVVAMFGQVPGVNQDVDGVKIYTQTTLQDVKTPKTHMQVFISFYIFLHLYIIITIHIFKGFEFLIVQGRRRH